MGPGSIENDPFVVPPGALRILARNGDSEVLIVHGDDREIGRGERLAIVEWFPSIAIAEAVSHECSRLLVATQFRMEKGWHAFPVEHLGKLVQVAKNHLNVTYHPAAAEPAERQAWTRERCALLGFLAGLGWTAKMIADDPRIRSNANNVYRQAHKLGIYLGDAPQGQTSIRLPVGVTAFYERAAERARMTRKAFIERLLIRQASEPAAPATS